MSGAGGRKRKRAGAWLSKGAYRTLDGAILRGRAAVEAAERDEFYSSLSAAERLELAEKAAIDKALAEGTTASSIWTSLENYSVPTTAVAAYATAGVKCLYPWQRDCLLHFYGAALKGHSLVFTAPTSGGKTLIAEILALRKLRQAGAVRRVIFVVPLVSLVTDKVRWLERVWVGLNLSVRGFYQNKGGATLEGVDVAVCTIERANGLINRLLAEGRASELSLLVIDELHMMADVRRGYLLEAMVMKVRLACGGLLPPAAGDRGAGSAWSPAHETSVLHNASGRSGGRPAALPPPPPVQIVGMSATLPNLQDVSSWLGGYLFTASERPLPLREYVLADGVQYKAGAFAAESLKAAASGASVVAPVLEPVRAFVSSRSSALPASSPASAQSSSSAPAADAVYLPQECTDIKFIMLPPAPQRGKGFPPILPPPDALSLVSSLCAEAVARAHSVLVFCATRSAAQLTAKRIAQSLGRFSAAAGSPDAGSARQPSFPGLVQQIASRTSNSQQLLGKLALTPFKLDAVLAETVPQSVAYHHAGLTAEERDVVEEGFRDGTLLVLVTTPTLAAGVNLPAQRVVFHGTETYDGAGITLQDPRGRPGRSRYLHPTLYRQMAGRAGRSGLMTAEAGEVFVVVTDSSGPLMPAKVPAAGSASASASAGSASGGGASAPLPRVKAAVLQLEGRQHVVAETGPVGRHMPDSRERLTKLVRGLYPTKPKNNAAASAVISSTGTPSTSSSSAVAEAARSGEEPFSLEACGSALELAACTMVAPLRRLVSSFASLSDIVESARQLAGAADATNRACAVAGVGVEGLKEAEKALVGENSAAAIAAPIVTPVAGGAMTQTASAPSSASMPPVGSIKPPQELPSPQDRVGFRRLLLELILCKLIPSVDDAVLAALASSTLVAQQARSQLAAEFGEPAASALASQAVLLHLQEAVQWLLRHDFIRRVRPAAGASTAAATAAAPRVVGPTQLGSACFYSALSPEEAIFAHAELDRARTGGLCLEDDMHCLALLTPCYLGEGGGSRQWEPPGDWWGSAVTWPASKLLGFTPSLLRRADPRTQRLYAASVLEKLLREEDLDSVVRDARDGSGSDGLARGTLQTFQNAAATYAGQVVTFAAELHWGDLASVLSVVARQLDFGVRPELLPLMAIPDITPQRARRLFSHGLKSPAEMLSAGVEAVASCLAAMEQFQHVKASTELRRAVVMAPPGGSTKTSMDRARGQAHELLRAADAFLNGKDA